MNQPNWPTILAGAILAAVVLYWMVAPPYEEQADDKPWGRMEPTRQALPQRVDKVLGPVGTKVHQELLQRVLELIGSKDRLDFASEAQLRIEYTIRVYTRRSDSVWVRTK